MLFFAARVVRHPAMQNPTLVVLTDRNNLDDQLFGQFQRCADILGQTPVQASGREHLRELLNRASGGVVFTTIQKFLPPDIGRSRGDETQTEKDQSLLTSSPTNPGRLPETLPDESFLFCRAIEDLIIAQRLAGWLRVCIIARP